jgi:hypothetical protein
MLLTLHSDGPCDRGNPCARPGWRLRRGVTAAGAVKRANQRSVTGLYGREQRACTNEPDRPAAGSRGPTLTRRRADSAACRPQAPTIASLTILESILDPTQSACANEPDGLAAR